MKIESIIKRKNGTTVQFGRAKYHFKPETPGGPHVSEVADEGHAETLLNIAEGYRDASEKTATQPKPLESVDPRTDTTEADAKVLALLGLPIVKIKLALPDLTSDEIATAIAFEKEADGPRTSLIDVLAAEIARRADDQGE